MQVCLLASGSKGNAIFIAAGASKLLVDCGLSATETLNRLAAIGVEGCELDAVLVSHEHTDHVRGAGTLARKLKIPLLVSYPTCREIHTSLRKTEVIEFEAGYQFTFRDILIDPFPITHDACDPVGFLIEAAAGRVGVATDLGIATRLVKDKLQGCRALVVESNHDEEMLLNGPYPWHLKQRIKSRHGHLSNNDSSELLADLLHSRLEAVFLAHLSEVNNDPSVALDVATRLIDSQNLCAPRIVVGEQHRPSDIWAA
ncbi:MBL fold metallo-hydrolase [Geomobilimonas luticola]|uniref:MBL fold metallo-hydrolase n=1 Tax=Geomobilimonas luticola TaxID=1114878 RepID=A0ABS5SFI5_9BACT|nr:MBL fold metallo-hydrolase [Geomobilimonas luticola]